MCVSYLSSGRKHCVVAAEFATDRHAAPEQYTPRREGSAIVTLKRTETGSPRDRAARARKRASWAVRFEESEAQGFTCGLFNRLRARGYPQLARSGLPETDMRSYLHWTAPLASPRSPARRSTSTKFASALSVNCGVTRIPTRTGISRGIRGL
jgi:hypothetical protein